MGNICRSPAGECTLRHLIAEAEEERIGLAPKIAEARLHFALEGVVIDNAQAQFTGKWGKSATGRGFVGMEYRIGTTGQARYEFEIPEKLLVKAKETKGEEAIRAKQQELLEKNPELAAVSAN